MCRTRIASCCCAQSLPVSLREAARRGLVTIAHTQCKKTPPNRLAKQDEAGMSLVHHAALFNRSHVLTLLVLFSLDVNVRRHNLSLALGMQTHQTHTYSAPHLILTCYTLTSPRTLESISLLRASY